MSKPSHPRPGRDAQKVKDTLKRWRELMEAVHAKYPNDSWRIARLSPETCFRSVLNLYSDLPESETEVLKDILTEVCKEHFNCSTKITFFPYPENFQKPDDGIPIPGALVDAKIVSFYPNTHIVGTSAGNARCRDSRVYKKGQKVVLISTVHNGNPWLQVR